MSAIYLERHQLDGFLGIAFVCGCQFYYNSVRGVHHLSPTMLTIYFLLLLCLRVNVILAEFCNFALQLETDPQLSHTGSIFTANASLFRSLGISPDTSAAANVGWFVGDAGIYFHFVTRFLFKYMYVL